MGNELFQTIAKFLLFGMLNMFVAQKKGFNPWIWLIAAGPLGLVVLAIMPSAKANGLDLPTQEKRRKRGNIAAIVLLTVVTVIVLILSVLSIVWQRKF